MKFTKVIRRFWFFFIYLALAITMIGCQQITDNYVINSGFYPAPVLVDLSMLEKADSIFYTLDGSRPDRSSKLYANPILVDATAIEFAGISSIPTTPVEGPYPIQEFKWKMPMDTFPKAVILRFITYENARQKQIGCRTYFTENSFLKKYSMPLVSMITENSNLFDPKTGIYVPGTRYNEEGWEGDFWPPGNYREKGREWEKPAYIEIFDQTGLLLHSMNLGIRIDGAINGCFPQKSLRIISRKKYGDKSIPNLFFPKLDIAEFERLVLRNSGGDFISTHFRDALVHEICEKLNIETLAFSPCVLYINGEYWGIHNIREKYTGDYFKEHFGLDPAEITLLRASGMIAVIGNNQEFLKLLDYMSQNDVADDQHYNWVISKIDLDNYLDYMMAELYFANVDWPGNNVDIWKSGNGKWRWILTDFDNSFGYDKIGCEAIVTFNSFKHATMVGSTKWNNPDYSTFFFRSLLKNQRFKEAFLNRYNKLKSSTFKPKNILNKIDAYEELFENEMENHIKRWQYPASILVWKKEIGKMREFAEKRLHYLDQQFGVLAE